MPVFNYLKKVWPLLAVIVGAVLIFGDYAQFTVYIYKLSAVALILLIAKFMLDNRQEWGFFPTLDLDAAIGSAQQTPMGAAVIALAAIIFLCTVLFVSLAGAEPPPQAKPYLPILSQALNAQWPGAPLKYIPAGQVEQESGWKAKATLHTSRELGRGLTQMTIAYDSKGRERFNIYREAARSKALKAWNWQHDPYNVRYQLTFLALQDRANFKMVRPYTCDDTQAWKCALVCYNAGEGRWLQRRANARRAGIPADRWDAGLDRAYSPRESALLYGRPLYEAVNEYPRVIAKRAEKYKGYV